MKPTLCRVSRYSRPGVAQPDDQLHDSRYFLSSCPCRLFFFLVGLALLDDLGLGRRRRRRRAASAAAAASSAFGITTCTSIVSPSVTGFHFGVGRAGRARESTGAAQLADVHVDVLGDVRRQTLDLNLAGHEVEQAALQLHALGLALQQHRHGHDDRLVHRELVEVGVEQRVRDGIELIFLDEHLRSRAIELERDERVDAGVGVEDPQQRLRDRRSRRRLRAPCRPCWGRRRRPAAGPPRGGAALRSCPRPSA